MYAFVITSAAVAVNDLPVSLCVGDVFPADDPVVKAYPSFFADTPEKLRRTAPAPAPKARKKAAAKAD